jgi:hypothetical protein
MRSELDKVLSLSLPREDKEMLLYKNIVNLAKLHIPLP